MKTQVLGLLAVGLVCVGSPANASLLRMDATSTHPTSISDFFLLFDDTGNGLLEVSEVTSFSGVTLGSAGRFNILVNIPTIPDISIGTSCFGDTAFWCFESFDFITLPAPTTAWTYAIRTVSSPAPEPGALALFGLGLAGLGFTRRRRAN
jgi:hypothetical protein